MSCGSHVYWWDGELEDDCELPEDHEGHHSGRYACWEDEYESVECDDPAHDN